jgi:hypothetical protein
MPGTYPTNVDTPPLALSPEDATRVRTSGDRFVLFCNDDDSNSLTMRRTDGTDMAYRGFVSGVQDVGKGRLHWTADNGVDSSFEARRITPSEAGVPPWVESFGCFANPSGSRNNQVWSFGYNIGGGGASRINASEPAIGLGLESSFSPDETTNDYLELHWYAVTAGGTQRRPMSWTLNRTTSEVQGTINGDRITFGKDSGGLQTMVIQHDIDPVVTQPVTITLGRWTLLKVGVQFEHGDHGVLYQNHISGYKEICRVNADGHVAIGTGTHTKVAGNVGFNNSAPLAKPTITGSRGDNAALASLLTQLAAYGLITDGTS